MGFLLSIYTFIEAPYIFYLHSIICATFFWGIFPHSAPHSVRHLPLQVAAMVRITPCGKVSVLRSHAARESGAPYRHPHQSIEASFPQPVTYLLARIPAMPLRETRYRAGLEFGVEPS
jgi:hypothetical protein